MTGIPARYRNRPFAARRLGYAETGTAEWFAMRRGVMTGSRIAAVLGLSPWTSPFTCYWQMVGAIEEEQEETAPIEWGRRLEGVVVQKWGEAHPHTRLRQRAAVYQNIDRPWQVCSPDALVLEPTAGTPRATAILEAKTSRYDDEWGEAGTEEVPVWYRCQALWMLDTLQMSQCYFGVLFSGSDYREYVVRYHEADVAILRQAAVEFLARVAREEVPPLDGAEATYELVRTFHPEIDGSTVVLPEEIVAMQAVSQAAAREAEAALMEVRTTIADLMGTAKTAQDPSGRKCADRRSRAGGRPYVQMVDLTKPPTIAQAAKVKGITIKNGA